TLPPRLDPPPSSRTPTAHPPSIRLDPDARLGDRIYRRLPVGFPDIHPDTLAVLIRPRQRAHLPVTFRPTESGEFRALFLLRNNLTGVEPLLAVGPRARVELRASADSMEFGLGRSHRPRAAVSAADDCQSRPADCATPGRRLSAATPAAAPTPALWWPRARRSAWGRTSRLHMAVTFTPDLCQLRVTTRELRLVGGALRVVLRGGLTPTQVAACSARLPRPPWETPLQTCRLGWCCFGRRPVGHHVRLRHRRPGCRLRRLLPLPPHPPLVPIPLRLLSSAADSRCRSAADRSADSGLFSRLTAWLPCWWRRQRRAGRLAAAADGSLSVGGSSARGQASVGRHAAAASPGQVSGLQQAAASTTASTGQPTVRRSRKLATAAAASQSTPSPSSTSADVGSPPLTAAAIRTPQFEPIAFPQIDAQEGRPGPFWQQPSLAANGGRKASAGAAGQDQLRRQQQRQVQQASGRLNGSASDASSWETAGSAFQRVGAGNQRSVKAASSGFWQAQQQQQSAAVPTVSVRAVPLQPLQCKQQPKTSVVKPMMTHPRLRRGKALRTCILMSAAVLSVLCARQQQQQQQGNSSSSCTRSQVPQPRPGGALVPGEAALRAGAGHLQKSSRMFHSTEELRGVSSCCSRRQLSSNSRRPGRISGGGFLDSGSSGGPNDPDDDENAGAVVRRQQQRPGGSDAAWRDSAVGFACPS
uniref:SHR-BD domain-containing protein n=1 Tax=Macrostomum lignano TaxID=282301 RepID=A0A1I8JQ33_9PLAT